MTHYPQPHRRPTPMSDQKNRKAVYTVVEREGKKPIWLRLGIAFVNRDLSINVVLDALPVTGKLHIRDFPPREGGETGEE